MSRSRKRRRRAAAQARQIVSHGTTHPPRRTGYLGRLLAAANRGWQPSHGGTVSCVHSPECRMRSGGACSCVPEISVSGPDGITVIDERGEIQRHVKQ
jgi:hypothetical protein